MVRGHPTPYTLTRQRCTPHQKNNQCLLTVHTPTELVAEAGAYHKLLSEQVWCVVVMVLAFTPTLLVAYRCWSSQSLGVEGVGCWTPPDAGLVSLVSDLLDY